MRKRQIEVVPQHIFLSSVVIQKTGFFIIEEGKMANIKFYSQEQIPLEMHKVKTITKLNLLPVEERLKAMKEAGSNTFLLKNRDIYLDMLTDSGVNAMSDRQQSAMMIADDAYAGSQTFYRLKDKLKEIFGMEYFLPAHQGRACENILCAKLVEEGCVVPMNYHFTTTRSHIVRNGGSVVELIIDEGLNPESDYPFKGNFNLEKLENIIQQYGKDRIPFVRIEAGTNLIGGQPLSLENIKAVSKICKEHGILSMMDASLLQDNLYFIKTREEACKDMTIREITKEISDHLDIIYFSARKLGFGRGGGIILKDKALYESMMELIPLFEGFMTYGGMSVREMEAITVGLDETMDIDMISHGPQFIEYIARELCERNIPVITPAGGLGVHLNAMKIADHLPQNQYPAGALASALYIVSGIRGMERGTMSEDRDENGNEKMSDMELVRLAFPRRVFTLSQAKYAVDRISWLYDNRKLIGGLVYEYEPKVMRFFLGTLNPIGDWQEKLVEKFREDFGDSL